MPVPTDTFWNIRRLNRVFAAATVLLLASVLWSVIQDWDKSWREPQRQGRVWEAALAEEKIHRAMTPNEAAKLNDLKSLVGQLDAAVKSGNVDFQTLAADVEQIETRYTDRLVLTAREKQSLEAIRTLLTDPQRQKQLAAFGGLTQQIQQRESQIATRTFKANNLKATVQVAEGNLQEARTAGNTQLIAKLEAELVGPRATLAEDTRQLAQWTRELTDLRQQRSELTKEIDDLRKLSNKLGSDVDLMRKKLESLDPSQIQDTATRLKARASDFGRGQPLLQFVNPSEKVRQLVLPDVLTDVSFTRIETIDRCTTCHVHIDSKDFTEERVLGYLEEQLATGRKVHFSPAKKAEDPTPESPGAAGMPEFWHLWGVKLAPAAVLKSIKSINAIAGTVGKSAKVIYQGKAVDAFKYDPAARTDEERQKQDAILVELIKAWYQFDVPQAGSQALAARSEGGDVVVEIAGNTDATAAGAVRDEAFGYVGQIRAALAQQLPAETWKGLKDRYRAALVENVNVFRREQGYAALDSSPVLLAHPRLDLYADVDSPHSMDAVGCTSCHDGSGQETNFVLAAHSARRIWVDQRSGEPVLPQQVTAANSKPEAGPDLSDLLKTAMSGNPVSLHFDQLAKGHAATTRPAGEAEEAEAGPEPEAESKPVSYVDPVSGKAGTAVPQIRYWAKKYEKESGTSFEEVYHYWDWPMRTPEFIEANCARCHVNIHDIKEEAPVLYEGRALFAKFGCVNCHQMDSVPTDEATRKVGPDLRHVTEKLSKAFIESWVWAPKAFRPSTMMPHFFMLENNSSDEELRRTQQEVRAIATYLLTTATPTPTSEILSRPENKMPAAADDDEAAVAERVERGRALFIGLQKDDSGVSGIVDKQAGLGCIACHTNLNEVGQKWITTDLERRQGMKRPDAVKRYQAMSYNERQLYAFENFPEPIGTTRIPMYADGKTPRPVFQHHGPELSGIGTKLLAGGRSKAEARQWLYAWLMDPRHYSDYTVMPRLRLAPDQAVDLAEYLLAQRRSADPKKDAWQATEIQPDPDKLNELVAWFLRSQADEQTARTMAVDDAQMTQLAAMTLRNRLTDTAEARKKAAALGLEDKQLVFLGQKLISFYGCMNCHAINGLEGVASPCANLSDWGQKSVDKLDFGFLVPEKHEELPKTSAVPMVNGLSPDAVTKVTAALNAKRWSEPITQDAEVAWPEVGHSRESWLEHKLKNSRVYDRGKNLLEPMRLKNTDGTPRLDEIKDDSGKVLRMVPAVDPTNAGKPYDKLRMPTFYFKDEQIHALITFVISNRDHLISPKLLAKVNDEQAQRVARGRQIVEKYNCIGCHRIEGNEPAVQQYWLQGYFDKADLVPKAPPSLRGEGNRIQHAWLFNFLKNVEREGTGALGKIRPLPFIRMPSFPITDEDATAVAAYFSAASIKESRTLRQHLDGLMKDAAKSAGDGAADPATLWPAEDWFRQDKYAALAAYLKDWALDNTPLKPIDFAPNSPPASMEKAYRTALYDARFISDLYDAKYPFVDTPRPTPSDERFKKGELFFHYMQCQSCHVVGDDAATGVTQQAKGPNLSLVYRRLQRNWVRRWVQETQLVQAGSIMPPYFSGRAVAALDEKDKGRYVFSLHGLPYLPSPPSAELIKQLQANFGQTVEDQADLLIDFINAAGVRGYTSLNPPEGKTVDLAPVPADFQAMPIPGITAPLPEVTKPAEEAPSAPQPKPAAPTVAASGPAIVGRVVFAGATPQLKMLDISGTAQCAMQHPGGKIPDETIVVGKDNGLANVVVSVKNAPTGGAAITEPAVLDQKGCMYYPHVLALMVGQPILIRNDDAFQHNVHALPENNPTFNFSQGNIDPGKPVDAMRTAETFRVKCDVHPWMGCHFAVFDHPYFAVTDKDGNFTINNLPPGTYTIATWHEKCPPVEQQVTVEAGKSAQVSLSLKVEE